MIGLAFNFEFSSHERYQTRGNRKAETGSAVLSLWLRCRLVQIQKKLAFAFQTECRFPSRLHGTSNSGPTFKDVRLFNSELYRTLLSKFQALITRLTITCRSRVRSPMMKAGDIGSDFKNQLNIFFNTFKRE